MMHRGEKARIAEKGNFWKEQKEDVEETQCCSAVVVWKGV